MGTATTSNGTTTFRDAGGNTTARSFTTGNTKTNYDSRGNVISRETTTGNTTTVYDPAGRNVGASRRSRSTNSDSHRVIPVIHGYPRYFGGFPASKVCRSYETLFQ